MQFNYKRVCVLPEQLEYSLIREGEEKILRFNYEFYPKVPSIEDDPLVMSSIIETIAEVGTVSRIVLFQKRDFEYDYGQTQLLVEIAQLFRKVVKEKYLEAYRRLLTDPMGLKCLANRAGEFQRLLYEQLKSDVVGSYVTLKRLAREERLRREVMLDARCGPIFDQYLNLLDTLQTHMEETRIIQSAQAALAGYKVGDRTIYRDLFYPTIKPDFLFTKLQAQYPSNGIEEDAYLVDDTEVTIFSFPDSVINLYHVLPPEFRLAEDEYELLDTARTIMAEHKPSKEEFIDPERVREVFFNVGHDLLEELSTSRNIPLSEQRLEKLTEILVRYTVGFGLIEVLLADEKIQDISINSPQGQLTIFIVHGDFGECTTNIVPTRTDAESWASKLRLISGRPLDEANPILDTEIALPTSRARVSVITNPLDPTGLAYSFRRHRDDPWTLALFIKTKMINSLAAGLISFLVDGTRTVLVTGTRSSGKTSVLGSLLVEIMRRYRVITIEDTLELPSESLRKLGYNIQSMKVAGALAKPGAEVSATDGIRATLRLGDSALFIGEVRSQEAISLYEAMRVGAAANVVAGTIHAESPYGVYDRVVNDIGVPKTSFKATDIIIVANPIRLAGGIRRVRRVLSITEIRKHWENDPLLEGGFVDLMKYNVETDQLEPTADLLNGDSEVLKTIASNVRGLAGDWDAVWDNILLRGRVKETLVKYADKFKMDDILEAKFAIQTNDMFHTILRNVQEELGKADSERIFFEWEEWLKRELKKRKLGEF
ncbi:type II/IV secretion system ATPase subunit [Candidatus Woesearchaeota archaeon]|nr:type II/IV secretion system ATPase subunit [Candidatus Woesearchaeota archaeon]